MRAVRRAVIEVLDRRTLLSVTLGSDGKLSVTGTNGADHISVAATQFVNALAVDDNGDLHYYSLSAIKSIWINTGDGDDRVMVDAALNAMSYDCIIDGGAGNDNLTGAGHNVIVTGEDGNDRIRGLGTGYNNLSGGNGSDVITAADGNDTIGGGSGNDKIYGNGGNDQINSGKGNDIVFGGDGDDTIADPVGKDEIHGGGGNDFINAYGAAKVFGEGGNDNLFGTMVSGGDGNDIIDGTSAGDLLHGDGGDDLIRGGGGKDMLFGDGGNDALFGGTDSDTVNAGTGADNLYGDDGVGSVKGQDFGHDLGLGGSGADWFESGYVWQHVDWNKNVDAKAQNNLSQDPSYGHYAANQPVYTIDSSGSVTVSGGTLQLGGINSSSTLMKLGGGTLILGNGTFDRVTTLIGTTPPTIQTKTLGDAGWLSSGAWDTTNSKFVPPPISVNLSYFKPQVVQLPADWVVGGMSTAKSGQLVWYQVSKPVTGTITGTVQVPTLDGGSATIPANTPGAVDGVRGVDDLTLITVGGLTYNGEPANAYRYIGVLRGSVIISGTGSLSDVEYKHFDVPLMSLPTAGAVRLAGFAGVHHLVREFLHVPSAVPEGAHAILVDDGAVWLSKDGSSSGFTAG